MTLPNIRISEASPAQEEGCTACSDEVSPAIDFAFQPIVDVQSRTVFACEALVRGTNGEPASTVLSQVNDGNRYQFDQRCRQVAIARAAGLGLDALLSINFMPNAVYHPETCIRTTLDAAQKYGLPPERIVFETLEGERIVDRANMVEIFKAYRKYGFRTAIDDFGAGYSGLSLLVDFQPDFLKLDMQVLRGIDTDTVRQRIVKGVLSISADLGIQVIAEGIETRGERDFFLAHGVKLMQGYLFARPAFRAIPVPAGEAFLP